MPIIAEPIINTCRLLYNYYQKARNFKMYAVLKTGGKQYRVEKEDVVLVEKLDANDGDQAL